MEKRILLVEDNDQFRKNFARTLERALAAEPLSTRRSWRRALCRGPSAAARRRAGRRADRCKAA